jgi:hypothetical protein
VLKNQIFLFVGADITASTAALFGINKNSSHMFYKINILFLSGSILWRQPVGQLQFSGECAAHQQL